jgi:hypothetical protein
LAVRAAERRPPAVDAPTGPGPHFVSPGIDAVLSGRIGRAVCARNAPRRPPPRCRSGTAHSPFTGLSRRSSPPRDSQRAQKGAGSPQDGGFGLFIWDNVSLIHIRRAALRPPKSTIGIHRPLQWWPRCIRPHLDCRAGRALWLNEGQQIDFDTEIGTNGKSAAINLKAR